MVGVGVVAVAEAPTTMNESLDDELSIFATTSSPVKHSTPIRKVQTQYTYSPHHHSPLTEFFKNIGKSRINHKNRYFFDSNYQKALNGVEQLDVRVLALLITLCIFVITYKMVLIASPYANVERVSEMWMYTQRKFLEIEQTIEWKYVWPLLCGLAFTMFSVAMVYMDSRVPGVIPPSPFSPRKQQRYGRQKRATMDFNYLSAFAAGFIVTVLLYTKSMADSL